MPPIFLSKGEIPEHLKYVSERRKNEKERLNGVSTRSWIRPSPDLCLHIMNKVESGFRISQYCLQPQAMKSSKSLL